MKSVHIGLDKKVTADNERFTYDFKQMKVKDNKDGTILPMRIDNEGGMIDVWSLEAGEFIWSDDATEAFKEHLGGRHTGLKDKFTSDIEEDESTAQANDHTEQMMREFQNMTSNGIMPMFEIEHDGEYHVFDIKCDEKGLEAGTSANIGFLSLNKEELTVEWDDAFRLDQHLEELYEKCYEYVLSGN